MRKKQHMIIYILLSILFSGCTLYMNTSNISEMELITQVDVLPTQKLETPSATTSPTNTITPTPTILVSTLPTPTPSSKSMKHLLSSALLPVGSTMYIWGGGWNKEDTGAGPGSTIIGTSPQWKIFYALQDETYQEKNHRYEIENGLDCSGYIGWIIYNVFEEKDNQEGYVFKSSTIASEYSKNGWGDCIQNPDTFLVGDIVSMSGHVWLSLGMCEDGSVVLLHSSPPGVSICGTKLADGSDSEAIKLATYYMETYFPEWQQKYPNRSVSHSYTKKVSVLRWNTTTLSDATSYQALDAQSTLQLLFDLE